MIWNNLDTIQNFEQSKTEFSDADVNNIVSALKKENRRWEVLTRLNDKFDDTVENAQKGKLKTATESVLIKEGETVVENTIDNPKSNRTVAWLLALHNLLDGGKGIDTDIQKNKNYYLWLFDASKNKEDDANKTDNKEATSNGTTPKEITETKIWWVAATEVQADKKTNISWKTTVWANGNTITFDGTEAQYEQNGKNYVVKTTKDTTGAITASEVYAITKDANNNVSLSYQPTMAYALETKKEWKTVQGADNIQYTWNTKTTEQNGITTETFESTSPVWYKKTKEGTKETSTRTTPTLVNGVDNIKEFVADGKTQTMKDTTDRIRKQNDKKERIWEKTQDNIISFYKPNGKSSFQKKYPEGTVDTLDSSWKTTKKTQLDWSRTDYCDAEGQEAKDGYISLEESFDASGNQLCQRRENADQTKIKEFDYDSKKGFETADNGGKYGYEYGSDKKRKKTTLTLKEPLLVELNGNKTSIAADVTYTLNEKGEIWKIDKLSRDAPELWLSDAWKSKVKIEGTVKWWDGKDKYTFTGDRNLVVEWYTNNQNYTINNYHKYKENLSSLGDINNKKEADILATIGYIKATDIDTWLKSKDLKTQAYVDLVVFAHNNPTLSKSFDISKTSTLLDERFKNLSNIQDDQISQYTNLVKNIPDNVISTLLTSASSKMDNKDKSTLLKLIYTSLDTTWKNDTEIVTAFDERIGTLSDLEDQKELKDTYDELIDKHIATITV